MPTNIILAFGFIIIFIALITGILVLLFWKEPPSPPAPSPIPHGTKAVLVVIMLLSTIAVIIRYALTHH